MLKDTHRETWKLQSLHPNPYKFDSLHYSLPRTRTCVKIKKAKPGRMVLFKDNWIKEQEADLSGTTPPRCRPVASTVNKLISLPYSWGPAIEVTNGNASSQAPPITTDSLWHNSNELSPEVASCRTQTHLYINRAALVRLQRLARMMWGHWIVSVKGPRVSSVLI